MHNKLGVQFCSHVVELPHEGERYAYFFGVDQHSYIGAVAKASSWGRGAHVRPFISGVHVYWGWRQNGVGRDLIRYITAAAKSESIESLAMYVHRDNHVALKLYESQGFRPMLDDGDNIMLVRFINELPEVPV